MSPPTDGPAKRLSLLEAITGSYATDLLLALFQIGVLQQLDRARTAAELERSSGIDRSVLEPCLEFLADATDVLERSSNGRYHLADVHYAEVAFQVGKFAGAYGNPIRSLGGHKPDGEALANAFSVATQHAGAMVPDSLRAADVHGVVDLGCGTGALLIQLATEEPGFLGVGIEYEPAMCQIARTTVDEAGLSGQIEILQGDARDPLRVLGPQRCSRIDAIYGRSFLNALFGAGRRGAVDVLSRMRRQLPGRRAWFVDYYGRLSHRPRHEYQPIAWLQDLAQVVSAQGIPPANLGSWRSIYREAGCRLIHAEDFEGPSITWFIHELELPNH
jgi:SAM-dependent methyltransferase